MTGRAIVVALVLGALIASLYAFSWNGDIAGFLSDDAVYLLMADGFSPYKSPEPGLTAYVMREALFPPLYPLLLALLGAGSGSLLWAHVITTTTLVLSLGIYGVWVHSEVRDHVPAIGLLVVFALAPGTLFQNLEIFSEFPYLMLSLLALWFAERARSTKRGYGLAALCVALVTLTRTAGLSLLLAFAVWLFRHRVRARVKWFAIAFIPSAMWFCYRKWVSTNKDGYGSLWSSLWEQSQTSRGYLPHFLENQGESLWRALLTTLDLTPSRLTEIVLGITLLAALPVLLRRLWHCRLDAWYLFIGGVMILLYPFPGFFTRLVLPWVPIVLYYAYLGVLGITARWGEFRGRPALAYCYLVALFITLIPSLEFISNRCAQPIPPELAAWKHTRYWFRLEDVSKASEEVRVRQGLIDASKEVARYVPEGHCVFGVHTAISMLYSRRVFQQPPPTSVSDSEFEAHSRVCDYFFLVPFAGQLNGARVEAFYPYGRLPADRVEIIHSWNEPRAPDAAKALLLRWKTAP